MLRIENISKSFGKVQALNDINLELGCGVHGLLGPNGAGKTTLMRIITTILVADQGKISYKDTVWDEHLNARSEVRRHIGYLPQRFGLYRQLTVDEALSHIGVLKGIKSGLKEEVSKSLAYVNLSEHRHKKMGELSGGMVRRVGIAQAILGHPDIVIVDEPTAGLDPEERIRFLRLLQGIGENAIVLISTHLVEDVQSICEHVTILKEGKIMIDGTVDKVTETANGNVWHLEQVGDNRSVTINSKDIIKEVKTDKGSLLTVIADKSPDSHAYLKQPTLEEAYLYYVGDQYGL